MNEEIKKGTEHPLNILANQALEVFSGLDFEIAMGPELESEWYNFDALNVSKDHPARDMQDTFYIKNAPPEFVSSGPRSPSSLPRPDHSEINSSSAVLRTHTTNVTARALETAGKEGNLPCAFISIGKVFRNEATDATHEMQFYQIDGTMLGEDVSIADLKGVLTHFYKNMLGDEIEMDFRPSFFPFVEPGLEVWLKFQNRWLEVMGAGMLHPNVIKNLGLDPKKVQGFAFGGGLDRIAMVKWNVPDVRLFYQGDLRLNQF